LKRTAWPGREPPDEAVRVVAGRMGHRVPGQEAKFAEAGELVVWPAGTPHKWWNAGQTELRMAGWCKPPGNMEFFLGALFASVKQHGGQPGLFDAAFLMTRYRSEHAMVELPSFVRLGLLPIVYGVGLVLGKYKKYKDAPEPLR
jgi:hypothetical protein